MHNFECTGKHKSLGVCDCKFKCSLCGDSKHNTASINCPKKAGICITRNQWKAIQKRKSQQPKNAFEGRSKLAPQASNTKGKDEVNVREWMPAQTDMVRQAKLVTFPSCTNDSGKSSALCTCCKVPELSYEDTLVRCYPNPTSEKLAEIRSLFPSVAECICDALCDQGLLVCQRILSPILILLRTIRLSML